MPSAGAAGAWSVGPAQAWHGENGRSQETAAPSQTGAYEGRQADRQSIKLILDEAVNAYMEPSVRQLSYRAVQPQKLATMLGKLSAGASATGNATKAEKRRVEAETVSRFR